MTIHVSLAIWPGTIETDSIELDNTTDHFTVMDQSSDCERSVVVHKREGT